MVEFLLAKEKARVRFPLPALQKLLPTFQSIIIIVYSANRGHGGIGRRNGLKSIEPYKGNPVGESFQNQGTLRCIVTSNPEPRLRYNYLNQVQRQNGSYLRLSYQIKRESILQALLSSNVSSGI